MTIGVIEVTVGYTGGNEEWPTYRSIKDSTEAVRVTFDPQILPFEDLLRLYFAQLGESIYHPCYSRQYRNAIVVHTEEHKAIADLFLAEKMSSGRMVHVAIEDGNLVDFYRAEEYHQKFYKKQSTKNRY
jgi:peptide methionine sulfoxide reductase MsrA